MKTRFFVSEVTPVNAPGKPTTFDVSLSVSPPGQGTENASVFASEPYGGGITLKGVKSSAFSPMPVVGQEWLMDLSNTGQTFKGVEAPAPATSKPAASTGG